MNEGKNLSIFFLKASLNFQHMTSTFANGKEVKLTVSSLREIINLLGAMMPNGYRGCVFLNSHRHTAWHSRKRPMQRYSFCVMR